MNLNSQLTHPCDGSGVVQVDVDSQEGAYAEARTAHFAGDPPRVRTNCYGEPKTDIDRYGDPSWFLEAGLPGHRLSSQRRMPVDWPTSIKWPSGSRMYARISRPYPLAQ